MYYFGKTAAFLKLSKLISFGGTRFKNCSKSQRFPFKTQLQYSIKAKCANCKHQLHWDWCHTCI